MMFSDDTSLPRANNLNGGDQSDTAAMSPDVLHEYQMRDSSASAFDADASRLSGEGSPIAMSPWNQTYGSPFTKTPFEEEDEVRKNGLIGALIREEGHIYSLAATKDLLYTGSDSKNIRVWKNLKEYAGFKSNSGLVKAIVIHAC